MGTAEGIISNILAEYRADDLPGDWEREPEDEDKLEGVVEGEPVNGANGAFKDSQESINNPVLLPFISRKLFAMTILGESIP